MKKKLLFSLAVLTVICLTTLAFERTQSFYKAYTLGERSFKAGDHERALAFFRKAFRIDPGDARVQAYLLRFAEALTWQKKYDQAIPLFVVLLEERPDDAGLMERLGDIYSWSGQYDQAIGFYQRILSRDAQAKNIVLKLAEALRLAGRDEEAVRAYDRFLKGAS